MPHRKAVWEKPPKVRISLPALFGFWGFTERWRISRLFLEGNGRKISCLAFVTITLNISSTKKTLANLMILLDKSCTTKDDDYPTIKKVLILPGGAGFPSTVWLVFTRVLGLFYKFQLWKLLRLSVWLINKQISHSKKFPRMYEIHSKWIMSLPNDKHILNSNP